MVRKTETVPVLFYFELTEEQARDVRGLYETEEQAADRQYVQVFGILLPLENFTHIKHDYWHVSTHITNTSGIVLRISECGTEVEAGMVY